MAAFRKPGAQCLAHSSCSGRQFSLPQSLPLLGQTSVKFICHSFLSDVVVGDEVVVSSQTSEFSSAIQIHQEHTGGLSPAQRDFLKRGGGKKSQYIFSRMAVPLSQLSLCPSQEEFEKALVWYESTLKLQPEFVPAKNRIQTIQCHLMLKKGRRSPQRAPPLPLSFLMLLKRKKESERKPIIVGIYF